MSQLEGAAALKDQRPLSELEKQGVIQAFEFCHELAWNVLKDYFEYQGNVGITGSRDAAREAFNRGLIEDGDLWMEMIKSRNKTSHTYNKSVAQEIVDKTFAQYVTAFKKLVEKMESLKAR
ncbi:MAG: nucleotidyltransferase substrate binding protein [Bdellovibrionaceae bacterium]|nr:nucleotidyltransferase substrate binding protein [Pseudobdellovibrionaceae bacterium]